jgi:putative ABC transport system permease protein
VAVLGQAATAGLFGGADPLGQFVKVNQQWFRVIGVAGPQLTAQADVAGLPAQDRNNLIYIPLFSSILRLEDSMSWQKDEIDAVYVTLAPSANVVSAGAVMRGLLDTSHRGASDFTVIVPAELLAEQQRTKRLFEIVMVAIASISLLVGGIGIMNIMLASVLERTREIGVRRAIGARQRDVVRQFLIETTIISLTGGVAGILLGVGLSQLIGILAGWSTIVTTGSIVLAFGVSVFIGIVFGLYPAVRASRLDPVTALHYE